MAVGFIILFLEGAFIELSEAECADEVFRVEFPEHGCDAAASDGFVAAGTEGATFAMVVGLAVRLAFMLEERSSVEGLATLLKGKENFKMNFITTKTFFITTLKYILISFEDNII